jgi:Tol biopolymer transport system component
LNGQPDVFVRDRLLGQTTRVSIDSSGNEQQLIGGDVITDAISGDGRYILFGSSASNLVPGDTNGHGGQMDVFLHDMQTGGTSRVSLGNSGSEANSGSDRADMSADGRLIAFDSTASNLVPNDTNNTADVFVRDTLTATTTLVSVDSFGFQGNGPSVGPTLSSDGRYVAFVSDASNLVPNDTNNAADVFVHDRLTGQTSRVSVDSSGNGAIANGNGSAPKTGVMSDSARGRRTSCLRTPTPCPISSFTTS